MVLIIVSRVVFLKRTVFNKTRGSSLINTLLSEVILACKCHGEVEIQVHKLVPPTAPYCTTLQSVLHNIYGLYKLCTGLQVLSLQMVRRTTLVVTHWKLGVNIRWVLESLNIRDSG